MKRSLLLVGIFCCAVVAAQQRAAPKKSGNGAAGGKQVYIRYCLTCHQADGGGVQNMNPPLAGSSYISGDKNRIIRIVINGFNENAEIDGQTYSNKMPAFPQLTNKEIADVLSYVRGHFGNKSGPVTEHEVEAARAGK